MLKRTKPFLNKCFPGLTKNLFPCRSNPHSKNMNYEYLEYTRGNDTTGSSDQSMIESRPAAASTMINEYGMSYTLMDTQLYEDETERTRNATVLANDNYLTMNSSTDMTLVEPKPHTSPITNHQHADYYNYTNDQNSSFDCMHSTQISNMDLCFQCQVPQNLSPMSNTGSSASSSTYSSSYSERPVSPISPPPPSLLSTTYSNSSAVESRFFATTESVDSSTFDSMIEYFSDTLSSDAEESHVCSSAYEATFVEDVSVHFADTVRIIRDNNDEWLYVRVASDGRQGYVPRNIVMDLKQFVDQLVKTRADLFNQN